MKKFVAVLLATCVLLCAGMIIVPKHSHTIPLKQNETESISQTIEQNNIEIRAVWISYIELSMKGKECTEDAFRKKAESMVKNIASSEMNTIFLHVRPCSDAFYKSSIFPYSEYLTGTEGNNPGFDPLEIFCEFAKKNNISIHAWINPFRICSKENWTTRSLNNPAISLAKNDKNILRTKSGLYYNPAEPEVQQLILDGVKEILENYNVDGIHIDDYFYPTTDSSIDRVSYMQYCNDGGKLSLSEWRQNNVNRLVQSIFSTVKSFGNDMIFSISPGASINRNIDELYADVQLWAKAPGYCDWLIPQIYVGFEHDTFPFLDCTLEWQSILNEKSGVKLIYGLSIYKSGEEDQNAGHGLNEWKENTDIIKRQIESIRYSKAYQGFALYSYSYAYGENISNFSELEISNIKSVLY